ncbi:type II secretion system protein [Candidatus Saccharibacteria bacterium]|nr:type II secretion system protein [Candidatus Saccharibacteria bacterium]
MTNQKNQLQKNKQGFTIIEVVLVLAIAGLIFLMVFIALPALQRSQRDTQRRDDMALFAAQLTQYQTNNGGVPKATGTTTELNAWQNFLGSYAKEIKDPSTGNTYTIADVTDCSSSCSQKSGNDVGVIHIYTNASCQGETPITRSGANNIAFTMKLEGAGIYCGHN